VKKSRGRLLEKCFERRIEMEAGFIVLMIVACVIAILAVVHIVNITSQSRKTHGVLIVDCSDPDDGPYLFLELKVPISDVISRKQVTLDVNITNYISHE
jgi:predicted nucleic acid-binding protein